MQMVAVISKHEAVADAVQSGAGSAVVGEEHLAGLPAAVQRYLTYSGIVGKPWVDTVRLKYRGQFRLAADKPWLGVEADQVYRTNPPGFQWKARFKVAGLPLMYGQDTYKDGQGHMVGKLAGLFTLFDAQGDEMMQGTMLRYLQEMSWFPAGYLNDYIRWQAVDDHAADVTYTYGGKSVTGRMFFDDRGRLLNFIAQRYREHQGSYSLDTWSTPTVEYATIGGVNLPVAGAGVWQLPQGDLSYIKVQLTSIVYNQPLDAF